MRLSEEQRVYEYGLPNGVGGGKPMHHRLIPALIVCVLMLTSYLHGGDTLYWAHSGWAEWRASLEEVEVAEVPEATIGGGYGSTGVTITGDLFVDGTVTTTSAIITGSTMTSGYYIDITGDLSHDTEIYGVTDGEAK